MQYLALIVPLLVVLVGVIKYRKELVWWEYLAVLFTPALFIVVTTSVIKNSVPTSTQAKSYYSTDVVYTEHWNEYIHKTCTEEYACGSESYSCGSGKTRSTCSRTKYCTRTYDCSYVDDHPARWELNFSGGHGKGINSSEFESYCSKWGTKRFVEMNRRYHTIDGDRYVCSWNNKPQDVTTYTMGSEYENRILGTQNVFGFRKVDSIDVARYGLPRNSSDEIFPTTTYGFTYGAKVTQQAYRELYEVNGIFGSTKKMTLQMAVFQDKPSDVCDVLESYWYGGKKNEVTLCINLIGDQVGSVKVITWAKDNLFKIQIRDSIASMGTFDALRAAKIFSGITMKAYQLRDFKEFDYIELDIELKTWHYVLIWILVTIVSIVIFLVVINNGSSLDRDWLYKKNRGSK